MKKTILGVVIGLVAWIVIATIGNWLLRAGIAGYADVEKSMAFTQPMMLARLVLGAVSSLGAGAVAARVAASGRAATLLAALLLLLFVPMHVGLWAKFPAWYHLTFLGSLAVLTLLGARMSIRRSGSAIAVE